jgi:hypothetical protein
MLPQLIGNPFAFRLGRWHSLDKAADIIVERPVTVFSELTKQPNANHLRSPSESRRVCAFQALHECCLSGVRWRQPRPVLARKSNPRADWRDRYRPSWPVSDGAFRGVGLNAERP